VSGILTLEETLEMIIGRATVIRDHWGSDKGAMMAVEGDYELVNQLLQQSNQASGSQATIACYNGPKSFTLAGPSKSVDMVADTISETAAFSSIKSKKLNVSNAFHSVLVESLRKPLEKVGRRLSFREPVIQIELATERETALGSLTYTHVADHMRNPVFFNHAVQRLARRYPECVWLEAGSNSTITTMASRALENPSISCFQPMNMSTAKSLDLLTDTTLTLWKQGVSATFWPHHRCQTEEYEPLFLPPYQFAKTRHWVELKKPELLKPIADTLDASDDEAADGLWSFIEYQNDEKRKARFRVNTRTQGFEEFVKGHTIAQAAPLCPSTLQLSIVIDALMSLRPDYAANNFQPQLSGLENHAPMCIDTSRVVWLDFEAEGKSDHVWNFQMVSNHVREASSETLHVTGAIVFRPTDDVQLHREFARYEHLLGHERCQQLLHDQNAPDVIQGRNIYRTFAEIVDYTEPYRGLQKLVGSGSQSAGRIVKEHMSQTWLDTHLADSFCQVAGIFVNCMTDTPKTDIAISTKIEEWIRSPKFGPGEPRPDVWDVLAVHRRPSDKEWMSDVFIFDPRDGSLVEMILGIGYQRVSRTGLGKMLSRLTGVDNSVQATVTPSTTEPLIPNTNAQAGPLVNGTSHSANEKKDARNSRPDISSSVRTLLASVSGLEPDEIQTNTRLADIGIDSLVGMELAREIEGIFKCTLDNAALMEIDDFSSLTRTIKKVLGIDMDASEPGVEKPVTSATAKVHLNGRITPGTDSEEPDIDSISYTKELQNCPPTPPEESLRIPAEVILEAFAESKRATDSFIANNKFGGYVEKVLPKQTELCVAYVAEAFERLGAPLGRGNAGQVVTRVPHIEKQRKLVDYLYRKLLCQETQIIEMRGTQIVRTSASLPSRSADNLLAELIRDFPDHANDHRLIHLAGSKLADCLSGKSDGVRVIFGSAEGRELVSGLYGQSPINMAFLKQMEDLIERIISKLPSDQGPLKILEMGAGTGGTTAGMVKLLAKMDVAVEYTFTDISPSLVAAARKRFGQHDFMSFRTHDIEKAPAPDLVQSQHIVIANNCVHATRSLETSTRNMHQVLRPDGFVMILEMTDTLYWVDLVFGLLEGWWLFEDEREHVVAHQSFWQQKLFSAGYGHVDWTEGHRPEANLQRIIMALASPNRYERTPHHPTTRNPSANLAARQAVIDKYVQKYSESLSTPVISSGSMHQSKACVLVTGATGSLGSHLVAHLAQIAEVESIICLNRRSNANPPHARQRHSMESKGIMMNDISWSKLRVFETDTSKPMLGLSKQDYRDLVISVTHIVHNAWPMSINRPVEGYEPQFQIMRNLIDFARQSSSMRSPEHKVSFQFISSIATVGLYPVWTGRSLVPEERVTIESVLPSGYSDAKFVCERMLDETLHKQTSSFSAMAVRIGQIAGSKTSGYWNSAEHLAFLLRSSQAVNALPRLDGDLSWCPVNTVAATLADLLLSEQEPYPIYHIENPARQPWKTMLPLLAENLHIPQANMVAFEEWVRLVRSFPKERRSENPAIQLIGFLEEHFVRMSCGELILDTSKARSHSQTLATEGPVTAELVQKYIQAWKASGFLT
jgi:thioester reductase-like protein/SAM-dependent methyltransferase/acyl carrier protein